MLPFQQHIISELLEDTNGALVVLSSGLGFPNIISSLLHLHSPSQSSLFILNTNDSQKLAIKQTLQTLPLHKPPLEIFSEFTSQERQSIYSHGGIFFITSRILIVDLLHSRVPLSTVSGLIILNAHKLTETCTESFIVRIFRTFNRSGYVRAFTDKPQSMVSGFAKTERIMKSLFVKKLILYPRFQCSVSGDLERDPPTVIDVRIPMAGSMKGIQSSILEAMDACLKELKKSNKIDVEDLTVENGLFKSFDEIVRRQLDPIWHVVGKKTKQLVQDLRTLRKLLDYLVRYDSVTYLKYLDTLRVSEGVRSMWIFAKSSHKVFELAKKRVYQLVKGEKDDGKFQSGSGSSKRRKVKEGSGNENNASEGSSSKEKVDAETSSGIVLEVVLEEAPKWKVLREVLEEIEEERQKQTLSGEEGFMNEAPENDGSTVLVACKDERSCMQLQDCIMRGSRQVMREEWEKYLLGKAELHGLQTRSKKKYQDHHPKGFGVLNGTIPVGSRNNTEVTSLCKVEHDALLAAAAEMSNLVTEEIIVGDNSQPRGGKGGSRRGRGRGRSTKSARAKVRTPGTKDKKKLTNMNQSERSESENVDKKGENDQINTATDDGMHAKPLPMVQFYALDSDQHILDVLKPLVIVVYHPDMTFVREIEIYKAENPSMNLKVYFLFYEDSTEVQKFEAGIRRENGAFESLIRQKSLMMIPVDQDGRCLGLAASTEPQSLIAQNSLTRKAGSRKLPEKEMQVIVDTREFMSSLPNVLHQKGMKILPVILEVGDYILSPLMCVERKSISDLYQSFTSGRLYNQVETMVRYYQIPVLLIEFSQDKSFSFQSASDIGDDVLPTSIISKLSLLVLHFPRLRIIWSRSLHATAEIFVSLKANQDEPDESKAMRVGVPTDEGIVENDVRAENFNTSAVEFLRRLPGVTDSNYRALMDGCKSLAELALLPVERLAELMGGQKAARTLRDFLDAKFPTML